MTVIAASTLTEGLLTDYKDAYMNTRRELDARVALLMDMGWFTNGRSNSRAYFEAAPHMRFQAQGDPIEEEGMDSKAFTVTNYPYSLRVGWHKDDREDDRTGSLYEAAQGGGKSAALLPERALFDLLGGTTTLIPAVPNAADGTAIFSSSTRFGAANGNLLTSFSVASGPAVRSGIWDTIEQFRAYQDGKDQPLFTDSQLDGGYLVIHAAADMEVFAEAFMQNPTSYAASSSNAGVGNTLIQGGHTFKMWPTQRVATGVCYVALLNPPVKPFGMQQRTKIVESFANEDNSDSARNTGDEYVQWRQRLGFGAGVVYSIIKRTS